MVLSAGDWCVLGVYAALLAGGALLVRRRAADARDYFVGHGQMPSWAVSISILASAISVASVLGAPDAAYGGDLTYLIGNLGAVAAVVVVALVFIPRYYRERVVTVYQLIDHAYGPRARAACSASFLIGRLLASGVRLYFAALPLAALFTGGVQDQTLPMILAVAVLSAVAISYTLAGGISSVIWTDVMQFAVTALAMAGAAAVVLHALPGSLSDTVHALAQAQTHGHSKLLVVDTSFDLGRSWTLWTALTGVFLLNLAAYGADQDLAQRMLTCRNAWEGGKSALLAIVINIPIVLTFLAIGLALYAIYVLPASLGHAAPADAPAGKERVLVSFLIHRMPGGLRGLLLCGIIASAFTSHLSGITAMASAAVNDFYRPWRPGRDERHYLATGRWAVVASGVALAAVAVAAIFWQRASSLGLLDFAMSVMTIPYCGLLGVFLCALLTARGSGGSAICALLAGMAACVALQCARLPDGSHRSLAWPWAMVGGTAISLAGCALGRMARATDPARAELAA